MDFYYLYVSFLIICQGVVLTSTGVFFSLTGGCLVLVITRWGIDMQRWAERKWNIASKPGF